MVCIYTLELLYFKVVNLHSAISAKHLFTLNSHFSFTSQVQLTSAVYIYCTKENKTFLRCDYLSSRVNFETTVKSNQALKASIM